MRDSVETFQILSTEGIQDDRIAEIKEQEARIRKTLDEIIQHSGYPEAYQQAQAELNHHFAARYEVEAPEHAIQLRAIRIICDKYCLLFPF